MTDSNFTVYFVRAQTVGYETNPGKNRYREESDIRKRAIFNLFGTIATAIEESRQSEQITSKSRDIGQQAVEPTQMRSNEFNHESDIDHREKRSDTYDIPLPTSEKQIATRHGEQYEGRIHSDLDFCERTARHLTDDDRNSFARHGYRTAPDLEGDADTHDRAACQLGEQLRSQRRAFQSRCQCHIQVNQPPENESYDQLEKLHGVESPSQDKNLTEYQDRIHRNRISADRPCRNTA